MFNVSSKEARALLLYFFLNPHRENYARELADKLGLDPANTDKSLKKLVGDGIVEWKKRGGHRMYSLNGGYPLLSEVRKIFLFKYGLADVLKKILVSLKGLEEAYIYGSYAKGGLEPESDIDILLVGGHSTTRAAELLVPLQKHFDRELNIIDMTKAELKGKKREKDGLVADIFKGKIIKII